MNKFPVIVLCKDEQELWEKLNCQETKDWVRSNIRTKHLYDTAFFHIREVSNENVRDICWKLDSLIEMVY